MDSVYQSRFVQIVLLLAMAVLILVQINNIGSIAFRFSIEKQTSVVVDLSSRINSFKEPVQFQSKRTSAYRRPVFRFVRRQVRTRKAHDYTIYLKGIVWDPASPTAVIAVGNASSELYVRPGQRIGDIQVVKISRDHVVLKIGSRRIVKTLSK